MGDWTEVKKVLRAKRTAKAKLNEMGLAAEKSLMNHTKEREGDGMKPEKNDQVNSVFWLWSNVISVDLHVFSDWEKRRVGRVQNREQTELSFFSKVFRLCSK